MKGNDSEKPKKGDMIEMEYTGCLYDEAAGEEKDFKGKQ